MLFFIAILCPPLALLLCGRPLSAILNFVWIIAGLLFVAALGYVFIPVVALGAMAHAIFVVSQHDADRRQRALITALGGTPEPKTYWELNILLALFILGGGLVVVLMHQGVIPWRLDTDAMKLVRIDKPDDAPSVTTPPPTTNAAPATSPPAATQLPPVEGWSMTEVEATYGPATHKDKTTGWAVWPNFKAHFTNGAVTRVEALELK